MSNLYPPLPPGFELEQPDATGSMMPPLPPGFELEPADAPEPRYGGVGMNTTAGANEMLYGALGAPVDLMAGAMNLGIRGFNSATGSDVGTIDEPFGGSRSIARGMGAVAPQLDPANTVTTTTADRVARSVGQGTAGAMIPAGIVGGLSRAGAIGPEAAAMGANIFGRSGSVGAVAADATAGATAGLGAGVAQEVAPERWKPLAAFAGGLLGGGIGSAAMAAPAAYRAAADYFAPLTAAGRERVAADLMRGAVDDPQAVRDVLDAGVPQKVPGSQPTTFQASGDMGLGTLEREMQTKFPAEFQQRRADQNAARLDALDAVQPSGAAEAVSAAIRRRLKTIDQETAADLDMVTQTARDRNIMMGASQNAEDAGDVIRDTLQARRDRVVQRENALWAAVDPDGTLTLAPKAVRGRVSEIISDLPKMAKPPGAEEAAIYQAVGSAGEMMPFREMSALRSRVSTALADERGRYGKSPAWARLVQLRGAIESDLENAVANKVMLDEQAVAAGTMRREDTLSANVERWGADWNVRRTEAAVGGDDPGRGFFGSGSAAPAVPSLSGATRATGARSSGAPRDPGLPQNAGGTGYGDPGSAIAPARTGIAPESRAFLASAGASGRGLPVSPEIPLRRDGGGGLPGDLQNAGGSSGFGRSRQTGGDPGLPQDAGGGAAPQRLTMDEIRAKPADDPFFIRSRDGQPFVPREPGNPDLGMAPRLDGRGDAPIRLKRSDLKHVATAGHQADAEILGYDDAWSMVNDITMNWSQMHRGEKGRVQLVIPGNPNGVGIVELTPVDGSEYWRVVTAGRRGDHQLGELLEVRARTPDTAAGSDSTFPRGPTMAGQDKRFTQASSAFEYTRPLAAGQGFRTFDDAAMGRLTRATDATKARAGTFDNRVLAPLLARPADHAPYNMESARAASRVFTPGPNGFERVTTYRQASGTTKSMAAIEGYALDRLRKAAMNEDGTMDPNKLSAWRKTYGDALRAFPELDIRISEAKRAAETVVEFAARRKAALDDAQKGALGRLVGVEDPQDVVKIVGGLFSRQDSVAQLRHLRQAVGDDKEALQGLRKAAAEFLTGRLVGNTEAATSGRSTIHADQFQTFVRQNRNALRTVFSEDEVKTFEAVAADLQQANRSLTAVKIPNQSNTAQDTQSVLRRVLDAGIEARGEIAAGAIGAAAGGSLGAAGGVGAAVLLNAFRQAGLTKVDDLVRDALLNPEQARILLEKVPRQIPKETARTFAQRYRATAIAAGMMADEDLPEDTPSGRLGAALFRGGAVSPDQAKNAAIARAMGMTK